MEKLGNWKHLFDYYVQISNSSEENENVYIFCIKLISYGKLLLNGVFVAGRPFNVFVGLTLGACLGVRVIF